MALPDEILPSAAPDFDELADSTDPALLEARAKLLREYTKAQKSQSSTFDKFVIRVLVPIALAVIAPWATWQFSHRADEVEAKVVTEASQLREALDEQRKAMEGRRERLQLIERQKAEELAAMSAMVTRLDSTLKMALIQMAVVRAFSESDDDWGGELDRDEVIEDIQAQMAMPNVDPQEIGDLVGESYDRIAKHRAGK